MMEEGKAKGYRVRNYWMWVAVLIIGMSLLLIHFQRTSTSAVGKIKGEGGAAKTKELTIGEEFHRETSIGLLFAKLAPKPAKPPQYKSYDKAEKVALPPPSFRGIAFEEAIVKRRSIRSYTKEPITLAQLSQILFAAQGITEKETAAYYPRGRTVPSAGALYPIEVYVVVGNVKGVAAGLYHYEVRGHLLEKLKEGDLRSEVTKAALGQEMFEGAAAVIIISAIFDRTRWKYGERGFRYVYMEAGHVGQNISLQVASLGLGSVCVGAFYDDKINTFVGVDGRSEAVLYLIPIGVPEK